MIADGEGLERLDILATRAKSRGHEVQKTLTMALACSKKNVSIYCLNCPHSLATENKHQSHKVVCENKDFCNIIMPSEYTEFNEYQKSDKIAFIIYTDLEL